MLMVPSSLWFIGIQGESNVILLTPKSFTGIKRIKRKSSITYYKHVYIHIYIYRWQITKELILHRSNRYVTKRKGVSNGEGCC